MYHKRTIKKYRKPIRKTRKNKGGMPFFRLNKNKTKVAPTSIRTQKDIHNAVNEWCQDPRAAQDKYGHISDWNTKAVTDMKGLFDKKYDFNDDITKWDVSNVKSMENMFREATKFNQPIGEWNVQNVETMLRMFSKAISFNQPIGKWNVKKVMIFDGMFNGARDFNQDIDDWADIFKSNRKTKIGYRNFYFTFHGAENFDQNLVKWQKGINEYRGLPDGNMNWIYAHYFTFCTDYTIDYINNHTGKKEYENLIPTKGYTTLRYENIYILELLVRIDATANPTRPTAADLFGEKFKNFDDLTREQQEEEMEKTNITREDAQKRGDKWRNYDPMLALYMMKRQKYTATADEMKNFRNTNWRYPRLNTNFNFIDRTEDLKKDKRYANYMPGQFIFSQHPYALNNNQSNQNEYIESMRLQDYKKEKELWDQDPNKSIFSHPTIKHSINKFAKRRKNDANNSFNWRPKMIVEHLDSPTINEMHQPSKVGGKPVRKTRKNRVLLPKLRKIDDSMKKHKYKLSYPTLKRKMAINEGIRNEVKKNNKTRRQAATAKKGRFNILRIYRRNNNKKQCKLITKDMRYIDKKYGLNKTTDIC